MPLRSLRSRLTLGVVALLAVVLALAGAYVASDADRAERQSLDDRLRRTAELTDTAALDAIERETPPPDERLSQVLRATGSSLVATLGPTVVLRAGVPVPYDPRAPLGYATIERGGQRVRVYTKTLRSDTIGGLAREQTTTSLRPVELRQSRLRRRLILLGAAMLLVAGLGTWLAADLVLRPLRRLRDHAREIADEDDLEQRVPVRGPAETRALAGSFNAMLARLGRSAGDRNRALEATRRFAADAGHELRTPLTSVQAVLSTLDRHPEMPSDARAQIVAEALTEQRRLVELLDGLQALARGDASAVEHGDVDLADVVATAVRVVGEQHPDAQIAVTLPSGEVPVPGWESGLRSIVVNLVENAVRHGRPGGRVTVEVHAAGLTVGPRIVVEDDGPGIRPEDRERLFEPFARAAGARGSGSGLGLAIVAQQAGHHGATIRVQDAESGGARFVVRFPRVA